MTKKEIAKYEIDLGMSRTKRLAHYLDWAAKNLPRQWLQYNILWQSINGFKTLPRLDSKEVEIVKGSMPGVRKVLLNVYQRGMVTARGVGVRATTDDADLLVHDVTQRSQGVANAINKFTQVVNLVNPSNIPKTEEMAPYRKNLTEYRSISTLFGAQDILRRLAVPKAEEKKTP